MCVGGGGGRGGVWYAMNGDERVEFLCPPI